METFPDGSRYCLGTLNSFETPVVTSELNVDEGGLELFDIS